jgi:hypothetical protein
VLHEEGGRHVLSILPFDFPFQPYGMILPAILICKLIILQYQMVI